MRAAIFLMLLFSMCGAQTRSTQKESQDTGGAVSAEVSTQLDVSAELKELRDMVVELRVMLSYTQGEVEVLEAENAAMKTRLTVTETEVTHLKMENEGTVTELKEHREELTALKTRLNEGETEVMNLKKENVELKTRLAATETEVEDLVTDSEAHGQELAALKTRLGAGETGIDDLKVENAAQEAELIAVKTSLAATVTEVENLKKEIKAAPKVAFSAALPSSEYTEAGNNDLNLVFSRIITNVGQAYSGVSGFFRAPVRGVYYFRFTVLDEPTSHHMIVRMFKNGGQVMWLSDYEKDAQHAYLTGGLALQLEEGDEVNMRIPAGCRLYDNGNNHSTFSGFLLFPL